MSTEFTSWVEDESNLAFPPHETAAITYRDTVLANAGLIAIRRWGHSNKAETEAEDMQRDIDYIQYVENPQDVIFQRRNIEDC